MNNENNPFEFNLDTDDIFADIDSPANKEIISLDVGAFQLTDSVEPDASKEIVVVEIPKIAPNERRIEDTPKLHSLDFNIPLFPKKVAINLVGMMDKLLDQSGVGGSRKKGADFFEIINIQQPDQPLVIQSNHFTLFTNLPFLAFRLKIGSSDRIYLYYTLADQVYLSYTKKDLEAFKAFYLKQFADRELECIAELSSDISDYDHTAFIKDHANQDFINSITLLPEFQIRLSQITGIQELAFVRPNLLQFQEYKDSALIELMKRACEASYKFVTTGGRVDYKADTHVGVKPLFCSNSIIPHIDKFKEIYWLNTNNYFSSQEKLTPEEDINNLIYFTENGYWKPSLEDLMKVSFADYLCFKTYRPDDIIPSSPNDFPLVFFSTLYLIDFIGRGAKALNITDTTAYSVLLLICNRKHLIRKNLFKNKNIDQTSDYAQLNPDHLPEDIELPMYRAETLFQRKSYDDKVPLIETPSEYRYYNINPIKFALYLETAFTELSEEEKTNNRAMFKAIYLKALDNYIAHYRKANYFICQSQIEEMINSLCVIHGVDKEYLYKIYEVPERMYLKDFNRLIILVKRISNTKYNLS